MNLLTTKIRQEIARHAESESPDECCGIIYKCNDGYKSERCTNTANNKKRYFRISASEYVKVSSLGKITAYYHSHTEDEIGIFSDTDKKISKAHGLPLIMCCVKNNKFLQYS